MFKTILIASAAVLAGLSPAFAGYFDLDEAVAGHPDTTWATLVRQIVPDLNAEGVARTVIDLRYLVDLGDGDPPPVPQLPLSLSSVVAEPIEVEGRTLTAMLVDLGPAEGWAVNVAALALFDENLTLLDVVNVGQDRLNTLRLPHLRISETSEALLTYSEHGNSNQVYGAYGLIMVRDGTFQVIDTFSTLDDRWCGHLRTQSLAFDSPPAGPGFWPIRAAITDRLADPDLTEDCGDEIVLPGFETTYSVTYAWSAAMGLYVADGDSLDAFYALNEARY